MFIGNPPGTYDHLLDFSRAVTGTLFFVPTVDFLDDVTTEAADHTSANEPQAPDALRPNANDGSLGIGSLKKEARHE